MKDRYSAFYVFNIVFQSIFTLLWQIALAVFLGWLFVSRLGAPEWLYVPLILIGVGTGLVSMIRFILAAMKSLDRLEEQRKIKEKKNRGNNNGNKE